MSTDPTPFQQLLGSPQLRCGARNQHLPDALPGYLVAYLATRADWVLREELAVLLWPQSSESEAQNNLRVNLTRLRAHLARWGLTDGLVAERRRLRLEIPTDIGALRAAHARGDWAAAAAGVQAPFLDGMSFRAFEVVGEWARGERIALQAQWRDALLRAADALSPSSRLELAQRYLAADPFDEEVLRLRLGALAQLGRVAEAQRVLAEFDALARAELGVGASSAVTDYARRLASPADPGTPLAHRAESEPPLLGREAELAALADALGHPGLVTVVGLGGSGKTHLAHAARSALASAFEGSLWLPLAATATAADVARGLADGLQLSRSAGHDPLAEAAECIGAQRWLLVLDSAEHLLADREPLHRLLSRLLDGCPQLRILVSSREPIGHPQEALLRLSGLALPQTGRPALEAAALQLFVREAQQVQPAFDARGAIDAVSEIARLTGGLPLALRIAAGWLRLASCADIAAEIRRGLAALEPMPGESPGLDAILAGTWAHLAPTERSALAQLSVFAGPFSVQAAAEVAQAALPVLGRLSDRGLLALAPTQSTKERTRFELHPLVQRFAAARLAEDRAARQAARARHADHVRHALERADALQREDLGRALREVGALLPDLRRAWAAALDGGVAPLFVATAAPRLYRYLRVVGDWDEGIALCTAAEEALDPESRADLAALAAVAAVRGRLLFHRGDVAAAEVAAQRGLAWARELGHRQGIAFGLLTLGTIHDRGGRYEAALAAFEEVRALALAAGDGALAAESASYMALPLVHLGRLAQAEAMWRERLAALREAGNWHGVARVLHNIATLMIDSGRAAEAIPMYEEGLRLCDEHGLVVTRAALLTGLVKSHWAEGRASLATDFAELAVAATSRTGERKLHAAALLQLAEIVLTSGDPVCGLPHAREALRLAHAGGDRNNLHGALDIYAQWRAGEGDLPRAALAWAVLLRQPDLSASIRRDIEANRRRVAPPAEVMAAAEAAAAQVDVTVLIERALAEYDERIG